MPRVRVPMGLVVLSLVGCTSTTPTPSPSPSLSPSPSPSPTPITTPLSLDDTTQAIVVELGDNASANILVLVNEELFDPLAPELATLDKDMRNEYWNPVTSIMPSTTADELRGFLHTVYTQKPFAGAFLIGNFPYIEGTIYEEWLPEWAGPADYHFMDLDGQWSDADGDGYFDHLTAGEGDRGPEIFISRLSAHNIDILGESEVDLMQDYFARNHAYRNGNRTTQNVAIYATYAHHFYGRNDLNSAT